jgi:hypothetical protein
LTHYTYNLVWKARSYDDRVDQDGRIYVYRNNVYQYSEYHNDWRNDWPIVFSFTPTQAGTYKIMFKINDDFGYKYSYSYYTIENGDASYFEITPVDVELGPIIHTLFIGNTAFYGISMRHFGLIPRGDRIGSIIAPLNHKIIGAVLLKREFDLICIGRSFLR